MNHEEDSKSHWNEQEVDHRTRNGPCNGLRNGPRNRNRTAQRGKDHQQHIYLCTNNLRALTAPWLNVSKINQDMVFYLTRLSESKVWSDLSSPYVVVITLRVNMWKRESREENRVNRRCAVIKGVRRCFITRMSDKHQEPFSSHLALKWHTREQEMRRSPKTTVIIILTLHFISVKLKFTKLRINDAHQCKWTSTHGIEM